MIPEPIFQAWRFIHTTMKSAQFHEALKVDTMFVFMKELCCATFILKNSGNSLLITFSRNTKFFMFCQLISDIKLSRCNDTVKDFYQYAVVDPGFPRREFQSRRGPQPTYLTNFSRKLHENEEILVQRGGHVPYAPTSTTDMGST